MIGGPQGKPLTRLTVEVRRTPGAASAHGLVLVDQNGVQLPGQTDIALEHPLGGVPRLTVTFIIDGKDIRFSEGAQHV